MKYFTKEVQIALVAITGIVVLFFGMKFLKGLTVFSSDDSYYVEFSDVSGLSISSPVYANGYRVGVVEDVIYNYDSQDLIVAKVGLDKQLRLPKGSSAEISSDLLGNVKLELVFGPNPVDVLAPGDTISGTQQQGMMGKAANMIPEIEKIVTADGQPVQLLVQTIIENKYYLSNILRQSWHPKHTGPIHRTC